MKIGKKKLPWASPNTITSTPAQILNAQDPCTLENYVPRHTAPKDVPPKENYLVFDQAATINRTAA